MTIEVPWIDLSDDKVNRLFELVAAAHYQSAMKNRNASSAAIVNSYFASGSMAQAISSSLLATGIRHAPVQEARKVFETATKEKVEEQLGHGFKIQGFGNSFFKNGIDPQWNPVLEYLTANFPEKSARIEQIKGYIGKDIYPNPAMFTAIACDLAKVPNGCEVAVFALMRIPAWVSLLL